LHQQLAKTPPTPKFHAILDAVGSHELYYHSEAYLAPDGVYSCPGSQIYGFGDVPREIWALFNKHLRPRWLGGTNRKYSGLVPARPTKKRLEALTGYVESNGLKPKVDSVFDFKDVLKAYERIMTGHARGKVVVKVSS